MNERNDGGPAFPCEQGHIPDGTWNQTFEPGMTLRDYFAAKAMPACYAVTCSQCDITGWPEDWKTGIAIDAYAMADAMLAARSKP